MGFGARLSYLRNEKNLSQSEMAKVFGVSQSTVGMWESEKRKIHNDKLVEIANYFEVSTDYLLGHKAPDHEEIDLKHLLMSGSMTYGGENISEKNLIVLARIVQSFLSED